MTPTDDIRPALDAKVARAASDTSLEPLRRLGLAFERGGLAALALELVTTLVEQIGCDYAEVSAVGAAEQRLAVAGVPTGATRLRWPLLSTPEPLFLSVDGDLARCARAELLMRALQPWLRVVCNQSPRQSVDRRLALLGARWRLSQRQSLVLQWLGLGLSNKEIAQRLGCSPKTVETHVSQLLRRSGHRGRGDLLQTVWGGDEHREKA